MSDKLLIEYILNGRKIKDEIDVTVLRCMTPFARRKAFGHLSDQVYRVLEAAEQGL